MLELLRDSSRRLTQGETAREIGISSQLLSKWNRTELLQPSLGYKRDRRTQGRVMRGYLLRDVVAGLYAKIAIEDLGFRGDQLREMVRLIQAGDEEALARAVVLTVKTTPGHMQHIFVSDTSLLASEEAELLKTEETNFADWDAFLAYLKEQDQFISCSTLKEAVDAILLVMAKKLEQDAIAASDNEAC